MQARELEGKKAIRRSAVILSEVKKIMDPSYMDPNFPVDIIRYDYIRNTILIRTHDNVLTVLSGEYDDDKWVEITKGSKYNNINYPVGYYSVLDI